MNLSSPDHAQGRTPMQVARRTPRFARIWLLMASHGYLSSRLTLRVGHGVGSAFPVMSLSDSSAELKKTVPPSP
jgi:hypothetical protein